MPAPLPPDRRPIASRELRVWRFAAGKLAGAGVSANFISMLGMVAAFGAAAALAMTPRLTGWNLRVHYLLAGALIQLRLLANMLDGMVAVAGGKSSRLGELYNEIPDRLSDTAILVAAGYSAWSDPALGWAAAAMALFVTYVRAVGNSLGVPGLFHGPMSKSHRMFTLTVVCFYLALAPLGWQPAVNLPWPPRAVGLMAFTLALIILGGLVTACRRLVRLARALRAGSNQE